MVSIEDLPIELYSFIYKHLSVIDLARCRRVNKRLKFTVDDYKLDELTIGDRNENTGDRWYFTNKNININNSVKLADMFGADYSTLTDQIMKLGLLRKLKRLKLTATGTVNGSKFFSYLIKFPNLEQLNIDFGLSLTEDNKSINHENLRILYIRHVQANDTLVVDTPKLNALVHGGYFDSIQIVNPQSIKFLHSQFLLTVGSDLSSFYNLEHFICQTLNVADHILSDLPKLKMFKYARREEVYPNRNAYQLDRQILTRLIQAKQQLERDDLEINFNDTKLINIHQLDVIERRLHFRDELLVHGPLFVEEEGLFDPEDGYDPLFVEVEELLDLENGYDPLYEDEDLFDLEDDYNPLYEDEDLFDPVDDYNPLYEDEDLFDPEDDYNPLY